MSTYDDRPPRQITSPANPRVKWLQSLRKRRTRDVERLAIIEGYDELVLALDAGVRPRSLFHSPAALVADSHGVIDRVTQLGGEIVELGEAAFARASYRESPDGWLAVVREPTTDLAELHLGPNPLVLVCEAIEKPGNLGAMLRTAEAAGVDAVIAASPVADWGNPNVVQSSKGTVFAVQVAAASSDDVLTWLRGHGLRIVAATPEATSLITDLDLSAPTAVVVGAEHEGVSTLWLDAADDAARLPMFGHVNSLNVATSAAIVIYEALRQRSS
ncbi:MAG: RNA methyltransferase [Nocardioidaceae bacterium]